MGIDVTAPERAPKRADLTFLRHRARPAAAVNSPLADFLAGRGRPRSASSTQARTPASQPHSASLPRSATPSAPARPAPNRQVPATPNRPAPAATAAQNLLDLSAPASPPGPGNSLDLS